jgi:hypothetical protein
MSQSLLVRETARHHDEVGSELEVAEYSQPLDPIKSFRCLLSSCLSGVTEEADPVARESLSTVRSLSRCERWHRSPDLLF